MPKGPGEMGAPGGARAAPVAGGVVGLTAVPGNEAAHPPPGPGAAKPVTAAAPLAGGGVKSVGLSLNATFLTSCLGFFNALLTVAAGLADAAPSKPSKSSLSLSSSALPHLLGQIVASTPANATAMNKFIST